MFIRNLSFFFFLTSASGAQCYTSLTVTLFGNTYTECICIAYFYYIWLDENASRITSLDVPHIVWIGFGILNRNLNHKLISWKNICSTQTKSRYIDLGNLGLILTICSFNENIPKHKTHLRLDYCSAATLDFVQLCKNVIRNLNMHCIMELLYTNNDWIRWTIIQYHVSTEYEIPDYNHIHAHMKNIRSFGTFSVATINSISNGFPWILCVLSARFVYWIVFSWSSLYIIPMGTSFYSSYWRWVWNVCMCNFCGRFNRQQLFYNEHFIPTINMFDNIAHFVTYEFLLNPHEFHHKK